MVLDLCSRRPGTAKLFQHLILLLKKGGVPEEVFINFAETALEDIKTCFKSREAAMRGLSIYEPSNKYSCKTFENARTACGPMPSCCISFDA